MAQNSGTLKTQILLRSDTTENWSNTDVEGKGGNAILGKGELGIELSADGQKVKIGDGKTAWKDLTYFGGEAPQVYEVTSFDSLPTENVNLGATGIVKVQIADTGKYSHTGYVYTENGWAAMDGNYDASNVYFDSDLTYTSTIGALKLASGKNSDVYAAKGKSLEEVIKRLMAETIAPTITPVSYTLSANGVVTDTGNNEIGSKIKQIKWAGTFNSGKYSYGSKDDAGNEYTADNGTGITATYAMRNSIDGQTSSAEDGTFTLAEEDYIQINSTSSDEYAKIYGTATWGASSRHPINNIGEVVDGTLGSGNSGEKSASIKVQGYRSSFVYIGEDCTTAVDNDFIRKASNKGNIGTAFGTLTIPAGTKRVMLAVPGTHNWTTSGKGCEDTAGMNLDIKDKFSRTTAVKVKGANDFEAADYTVFEFVNSNGVSATTFIIKIV